MEIEIKRLKPNPFRQLDRYPVNKQKVESLKRSIRETTFWNNILARPNGKGFEIAYGHHRLLALKELYPGTKKVDIPVSKLDDAMMIKIMANENGDEWALTTDVIDETVRVTKEFLTTQPGRSAGATTPAFAKAISEFLGGNWNYEKVYDSLKRQARISKGELDKEAISHLKAHTTAKEFQAAVNTTGASKRVQRKVARQISSGAVAVKEIKHAIIRETFPAKKRIKGLLDELREVTGDINQAEVGLRRVVIPNLKLLASHYKDAFQFLSALDRLNKAICKIREEVSHEHSRRHRQTDRRLLVG